MSDLAEMLKGDDDVSETVEQTEVESPSGDSAEEAPVQAQTEGDTDTGDTGDTEGGNTGSSPEPQTEAVNPEVAGLKAELARRTQRTRELEAQYQAMQQMLSQQGQQQTPKQEADFWEDPEGALRRHQEQVQQYVQQTTTQQRLQWSEAAARQRHQDFEAKVEVFRNMVSENPALVQQMNAQPDPAEFVYQTALKQERLSQIGDLETYEQKIRAEERQKIEAEMRAKIEAEIRQANGLPGSLSNARAAGGNSSPPQTNEALEDILNFRSPG